MVLNFSAYYERTGDQLQLCEQSDCAYFDESKAEFPSIIFSLKDHPCKHYSDALSAECVVVATAYLNNVVETLKKGCCVIFTEV